MQHQLRSIGCVEHKRTPMWTGNKPMGAISCLYVNHRNQIDLLVKTIRHTTTHMTCCSRVVCVCEQRRQKSERARTVCWTNERTKKRSCEATTIPVHTYTSIVEWWTRVLPSTVLSISFFDVWFSPRWTVRLSGWLSARVSNFFMHTHAGQLISSFVRCTHDTVVGDARSRVYPVVARATSADSAILLLFASRPPRLYIWWFSALGRRSAARALICYHDIGERP